VLNATASEGWKNDRSSRDGAWDRVSSLNGIRGLETLSALLRVRVKVISLTASEGWKNAPGQGVLSCIALVL
jgi:hypothetical protein